MSSTVVQRSRYVEVEPGVRVYVEDTGAGKPVVFLHTVAFDHQAFEYQFNELPRHGYRCIGIDFRGFGRSDRPYGKYDCDILADDVNAVLEALDLQEITLVGVSMGGAVAVRYMARHTGHRVAQLALVSATAPVFTRRDDFPYGLERSDADGSIEAAGKDRPLFIANAIKYFFRRPDSLSPEFTRWFHSIGMETSPYAMTSCLGWMRDMDLRPDLASIKVPTTIFHALEDNFAPFPLAEQLHAGIAGSEVVRFDNGGHGLFYEERQKFNDALMRFVG
ncbi:MAG: alpha/beta fold hydrolase [Chromatiales bacterium]